jgi:lysylphosphatidylglycerol synthetase-like protein (DUF2156 family)
MINTKEAATIVLSTLVLGILLSISQGFNIFLFTFASIFLVILVNIFAKKIASFYLDSEIEVGFWGINRFSSKSKAFSKSPFPAGIFFPILLTAVTLGKVVWLASLVFDVKPKSYRSAKRHGLYSYSEMTEEHIGLIAAAGIFANIAFAVIGYLVGLSEFSRLSIYYAFFNMIPLSELDGNKVFFGSIILWSFLAALVLVGMSYAIFLI